MKFEWDEQKRLENLAKHGLDFGEVPDMFAGLMGIGRDERREYGEDRFVGIGMTRGRILVVVFTEPNAETVRVISLRKALKHERVRYEQELRDRLGPG